MSKKSKLPKLRGADVLTDEGLKDTLELIHRLRLSLGMPEALTRADLHDLGDVAAEVFKRMEVMKAALVEENRNGRSLDS